MLKERELDVLDEAWEAWAHDGQLAPPGDWAIWLIRAGRGFGKTRAGAEWVSAVARANQGCRIALVGGSIEEVRRVMIEGPSGLLAVAHAGERAGTTFKNGVLRFANKATAHVYSAASPEGLRGPEHHFAWADELGKWRARAGAAAWDNLRLGLRLGEAPRMLVTTTPRPTALMRRVMRLDGLVQTLGRTRDNPHLPGSFVAAMVADYGGTRLGRQELDGELVEDVAGALWTRALIEGCRARATPELVRVVVGVDPPAGTEGDACGIVAAGLGADGRGYVIEDASVAGASPEGWARAVVACASRHSAERVVAEVNQGGAMVASVLRAVEATLPVRGVHATRGKAARAEPVAALYEQGRVRHVGAFPALEDELCGLVAGGGYEGPGRSPDRADACVWALTELMLARRGRVAVSGV
nr:terminase family protein [Sphingomonas sp. Y38-1Y]